MIINGDPRVIFSVVIPPEAHHPVLIYNVPECRMMAQRFRVATRILSTQDSIQIEYYIDTMICADFDNSVQVLETIFIDVVGKQLLLVIESMDVIKRNPRSAHVAVV